MQQELQDISEQIEEIIVWDFKTITNYIIEHYKKFILLIISFFIIFIVDHITFYNSTIFAAPSIIPGMIDNTAVFTTKKVKSKKVKGKK
jgi:hypothetical protein